jgi:hypothetical protein
VKPYLYEKLEMARKRWTEHTEVTPALLKFREKRRWQIALRRYVLDRNISTSYAPYFGLDIENLRKWFEMQFDQETNWDNFGKRWQFDHIVPVTFFDFSIDEELKLCWNFTNIRVEALQKNKDRGSRLDVLAAKGYFEDLYNATSYPVCRTMLDKINRLELTAFGTTANQQAFINQNREYLDLIANYSAFEFELLNRGRDQVQVRTELEFFKKINESFGIK